jgi:pimeloyl-ACP methyl ester carboxylesterase
MPAVRYAQSGDVSIGFMVVGEGPKDLVYVHGAVANLEVAWEQPLVVQFYERLASFSRLITFDRRGTGLSDRIMHIPTLETRMDDLRAVMDAAGPPGSAAQHVRILRDGLSLRRDVPGARAGLALYNPVVRGSWAPDFPWAPSEDETRREVEETRARWGTDDFVAEWARMSAPSRADDDDDFRRWLARS